MTIELRSDLCRLCDAHGRRVVEAYRSGNNEASRAYSFGGADLDHRLHADGRKAECAFAIWCDRDPYEVLDWSDHADDGKDLLLDELLRVDVKSTRPSGRLLLWPILKNPIYLKKKFHIMALMRGTGANWEDPLGWIDKDRFWRDKITADERTAPKLIAGTWFMHRDDLYPMHDFDEQRRLAAISIRAGIQWRYVQGLWP